MARLTKYMPDGKIVAAVAVGAYVLALIGALVPAVSPGAVAARVTGR